MGRKVSDLDGWRRRFVRRAADLAPASGCLFAIVILGSVLYPVSMSESPRHYSCISNHKQVALGELMYAEDYDDLLPPTRRWMDCTLPYAKNWSIFQCLAITHDRGAAKGSPSDSYGIAVNSTIARQPLKKVQESDRTPLTYDSEVLTKNLALPIRVGIARPGRHPESGGPGSIVSFVNGHAKWIADTQIGDLATTPGDIGRNTPYSQTGGQAP